MAQRRCSIEGCDKPARCRGWCRAHYQRWRRHGTTTALQSTYFRPALECTVDGCDNQREAHGLCNTHIQRWRKYGTTDLPPRPATCTVDGCDAKHYARGLCKLHYYRLKKYGDTAKPPTQRVSDEVLKYAGLHRRIQIARGSASQHPCADCEQQAAEWSYDHTGISERIEKGLRYSTDIGQYSPRCQSCHRRFDESGRNFLDVNL